MVATPRDGKVLDRRPKASSFTVEELVQQVLDGRVRIPKFQRDLKWGADDAERLLDSIYRGYPIGTLLFWVRKGDAQQIDYGTVSVDAPDMSEAWWVVDGQQRLNALVRTLAGAGHPAESFALYFDLEKQAFARPPLLEKQSIPDHWLPLTEVVDSERLLAWLLAHPHADQRLALAVGKRIREYGIPAYLVTTDDEFAVREIFSRLNETGKPLTSNEVFYARYGVRQGQPPADIREVSVRLAELGFGDLEPELLHSMMLATLEPIAEDRVPQLDETAAHQALIDLEAAARSVIQFLRESARIPHAELLPYELPLITLTRFFHFFPHAHDRNRELLSRWVWRGALWGEHQGNTTSKRATLAAIEPDDEHGSVQRLLAMVAQHRSAKIDRDIPLNGFRFRDADGKLIVLTLWSLGPRHLQTGELIRIPRDARSLFPPVRITSRLPDGMAANRMIHPADEGRTLRRALLEIRDPVILASHALTLDMVEALRASDVQRFAESRTAMLAAMAERLFASRMRDGESDRPPLSSLVVDDEMEE